MKKENLILKALRYLCLTCVIVIGFIAIVGTGGGSSDDSGSGAGDTTSPTASFAPSDNSTINETIQIVITFSESMDTSSLVISGSMAAEDDGGVWSTINYTNDTLTISPATSWTEGIARTLAIDASDTAGNSMTMLNLSYTVDATLPTASAAPSNGSTIGINGQIVITFSESMDTSSLVLGGSMAAEDNGGVWSTTNFTNDTLTISPATSWTAGSGTLTVDANDLASNSLVTLNLSYTVDSTPPTVIITSHSDGDQIFGNRTITLSGTLSDTATITSCTITLNGFNQSVTFFDQTSFTVDLDLADRANTIEVIAIDQVGNSGSSGTININYPFISLTDFQAADIVIGQADFTGQNPNQGGAAGANTVYLPDGNPAIYNGVLYLPDSGNNRVLGYNNIPTANNVGADFVLGQPDFLTTTAGYLANQMSEPGTVRVHNGKLFLSEGFEDPTGGNRVLIWNSAPTITQASADIVVGQTGFGVSNTGCTASSVNFTISIHVVDGKLIVVDMDNHRVLIWNTIPTTHGTPADIVLGQPDFTTNTLSPTASTSFYYPTDAWSDGTRLIVADIDNHRVLIWNTFPTANQTPADVVLGQADMTSNTSGVSDRDFTEPYRLTSNGNQLFIGNGNRILIWDTIPTTDYAPADRVLGQSNFTNNTPNDDNQDGNQDAAPSARTFNQPSGVYTYDDKLFIADHFNNRVLIFQAP